MFMTAYCRGGLFKEVELLESLQASFLAQLDQTNGQTLVTMLNAHSAWVTHIVDETLIKKSQKRKVYKAFKKYSDEVFEKLITRLLQDIDDVNVKGLMLVLVNGQVVHLRKRDNIRKLKEVGFKGVDALARERASLGETFDLVAAKYYEAVKKFCLNQKDLQDLELIF